MTRPIIVTVTAADPQTRAAVVRAEIVAKADEGYAPAGFTESGITAEIIFRRKQ